VLLVVLVWGGDAALKRVLRHRVPRPRAPVGVSRPS
jgi:hypothetical protein